MKKIFAIALLAATAALTAAAQVAVDAYSLSPVQLRGTARFVGMGGAFASLGGDVSCMTQNPAGLGIYRHSDIGFTFDISNRKYQGTTPTTITTDKETTVKFDNFAYVGVLNLGSGAMRALQWGFSYNRNTVFNRTSGGYTASSPSSMTNYAASESNGYPAESFLKNSDTGYNPYYDPYTDAGGTFYPNWFSVLMFQSYMTNNTTSTDEYSGLYNPAIGSHGDADFITTENGYSDEYNISFAGNVSDVFYWGFDIGIADMQYERRSTYSEHVQNAYIFNTDTRKLNTGTADFELYNYRRESGTGGNLKFGVIVRPIEMLRIGAAIHTPTWMSFTHSSFGDLTSNSSTVFSGDEIYNETPENVYNWRLYQPWRFMVGASMNIGSFGIVSVDYERIAYNDMKMKEENQDRWGGSKYEDNTFGNDDIKDMMQAANNVRVGFEARINNHFKVRAGYNWLSSAVKQAFRNDEYAIYTVGTDKSFLLDNSTSNISIGAGYQYKSWYIDATWQYVHRTGVYHAFTGYDGVTAPTASMKDTYNNFVISTGIRF